MTTNTDRCTRVTRKHFTAKHTLNISPRGEICTKAAHVYGLLRKNGAAHKTCPAASRTTPTARGETYLSFGNYVRQHNALVHMSRSHLGCFPNSTNGLAPVCIIEMCSSVTSELVNHVTCSHNNNATVGIFVNLNSTRVLRIPCEVSGVIFRVYCFMREYA